MAKQKHDPYAEFRTLSKSDQRDQILLITAMSIDAAPTSLARKIEIYFDETPETQERRTRCVDCGVVFWLHMDKDRAYVPADAVTSHLFRSRGDS